AENKPRQCGKRERDGGADNDGAPAPIRDQHHRKQQAELRLVGQQAKAKSGERGPPLQEEERAADQRRREEGVLPGGDIPQVDKVIGDRLAVRIDQKIATEEGAAENDQITKRKRPSDDRDDAHGARGWGSAIPGCTIALPLTLRRSRKRRDGAPRAPRS